MNITFLTELQRFISRHTHMFQQIDIRSECEDDRWYEIVIKTDRQEIILLGSDTNLHISEINDLNLVSDNND